MKLQARGHSRRPSGLTTFELLVVLLLAAILAVLVIFAAYMVTEPARQERRQEAQAQRKQQEALLQAQQAFQQGSEEIHQDARIAKVISDVSVIASTLDTYKLDTGNYPSQAVGLQALVTNAENNPKWNGPYLKNGLPIDPWGKPYQYKIPGDNGQEFTVFTIGPDGKTIASGQQ